MTREQYHALVERVEEYARRHPEAYKIRLGLLALFGYAYIWLMLAVIAAVLALLVLLAETLSGGVVIALLKLGWQAEERDRKSTRLNSRHRQRPYSDLCLQKKKNI